MLFSILKPSSNRSPYIFTLVQKVKHKVYKTQGGGGTLIFSAYVGSDPASTVHPQKILEISRTPKMYLKFLQPKKGNELLRIQIASSVYEYMK